MLARRLTIWFLVFVTSGLLWLAVPRNGHSEEICTTLNCVSRVKRKVEQQMRQQEMMRSGGSKSKRSRSKNGNNIIRFRGRSYSETLTIDSNYNDIQNSNADSVSIIWNRIGLGFTKQRYQRSGEYKSDQADSSSEYGVKWNQGYWIRTAHLSYTFGKDLTLTLGTNIWKEGNAWMNGMNSGYDSRKIESGNSDFTSFIDAVIIGYRFGLFEIVYGIKRDDYNFINFNCNDCSETVTEIVPNSIGGDFINIIKQSTPSFGWGITYQF